MNYELLHFISTTSLSTAAVVMATIGLVKTKGLVASLWERLREAQLNQKDLLTKNIKLASENVQLKAEIIMLKENSEVK